MSIENFQAPSLADLRSRYAKAYRFFTETNLGRQLWAWSQNRDVAGALAFHADLDRPPVRGIATAVRELWESHSSDRDWPTTKQDVGKMICVVLEVNGYKLTDRSGPVGIPHFNQGALYKFPKATNRVVDEDPEEIGPVAT